MVGLAHVDLEPERGAPLVAQVHQVGMRGGAVDLRLTPAEATQVGSVQHEHLHEDTPLSWSYDARSTCSSGSARIAGSGQAVEHDEAQLRATGLLVHTHGGEQLVEGERSPGSVANRVGSPTEARTAACRAAVSSSR